MLAGRDQGYALLKLKSGETRMVRADCMATVGAVSNPDHVNEVVGKAGRSRWKGARPVSRGIARNPVDHPNGGRTNGGKHWATPWGKPTKGKKTRNNKSTQKFIVRSRHDQESVRGKPVARSLWKGPFVDGYLLKKAEAARSGGRNTPVKTWSRRSTILPQFVGLTFQVHNGNKFIPVLVSRGHGRSQARRVRADPDFPWPFGVADKKATQRRQGCKT